MGVNKVVYNARVLVDLTGDTVTPETLCEGYTAINASGELIVGTLTATPGAADPSTERGCSKVVFGDRTLVDLTGVTAHPGVVSEGITFHGANGLAMTGTLSPLFRFEFPFSNESLTENKIVFVSEIPFDSESYNFEVVDGELFMDVDEDAEATYSFEINDGQLCLLLPEEYDAPQFEIEDGVLYYMEEE